MTASPCPECNDRVAAGIYCADCGLYDTTDDQIAADRETA